MQSGVIHVWSTDSRRVIINCTRILWFQYYVFGHYSSSYLYLETPSCLFFKTRRFGDWILSPSAGKTYSQGNSPIRHVETCPDFFFTARVHTTKSTVKILAANTHCKNSLKIAEHCQECNLPDPWRNVHP
jgi:hypothetical protein